MKNISYSYEIEFNMFLEISERDLLSVLWKFRIENRTVGHCKF